MNFSEKIKQIRQQRFLSQETFAKELGVSFATVNRWESGKTRPTYKTMKLIAEATISILIFRKSWRPRCDYAKEKTNCN